MKLLTKVFLTALVVAFACVGLAQTNVPGQIRARKTSYANGQTQEWIEVWGSSAPAMKGWKNAAGVVTNWEQRAVQFQSNGWHWVKAPVNKPWRVAYTNAVTAWTNQVDRTHPGWRLQSDLTAIVARYGGAATNSQADNLALIDTAFHNTNATGKVNVLMDSLKVERIYRWLDKMNYTPGTNPPMARVPVRRK